MYSYDFRELETKQLALETERHSKDLDKIDLRAWDTMGWAYIWICGAIIVTLAFLMLFSEGTHVPGTELIVIALWCGALHYFFEWNSAIDACKQFAAEMRQRKAELARRRYANSHIGNSSNG